MKADLGVFFKFLETEGLKPTFQSDNHVVFITMTIEKQDVPIFFAFISGNTLLQSITYLPLQMTEKTRGDVARLLHFLNKEIDLPGFGLDEKEKLIFYRSVIPVIDGEISEKWVKINLAAAKHVCETFMMAIALINSGTATLDAVMQKMK